MLSQSPKYHRRSSILHFLDGVEGESFEYSSRLSTALRDRGRREKVGEKKGGHLLPRQRGEEPREKRPRLKYAF